MTDADRHPTFSGAVSGQYDNYLSTVRGWVRQQVVRYHLLPVLEIYQEFQATEQLQILDFGGGNAQDALWLASLGHEVTVLDISNDELDKGRSACKAAPSSAADRVHLQLGNTLDLPRNQSFDVALSHGVLMYELDHPERQIAALAGILKQDGGLSLLTKGLFGATAEKQLIHDQDAVLELERTGRFVNRLGVAACAYSFEQLEEMVLGNGFSAIEGTFGVRIHSDQDYRKVAEIDPAERQQILQDEISASENPNFKDIGHMLHVIAVKA